MVFVDLEKAYDNVNRTRMWKVLRKLMPDDVDVIKDAKRMYENLQARVVGGSNKAIFINKGVK